MRLQAFQIANYKSVQNTELTYVSDKDGITVLAGQNESGKSSVLQALSDFETGALHTDARRELDGDDTNPIIQCQFLLESSDKDSLLSEEVNHEDWGELYQAVRKELLKNKALTLVRSFEGDNAYLKLLDDQSNIMQGLIDGIEIKDADEEPADTSVSTTTATTVQSAVATPAPTETAKKPKSPPSVDDIVKAIHRYTPAIIFFDDQQDLLPKSIKAAELESKTDTAKGYNAVRNIEKAFGISLLDLDKSSSRPSRTKKQTGFNQTVTADFKDFWTQKIHGDNKVDIEIAYHEGAGDGGVYEFYVLTKTDERLYPDQRSKGFQWYLSFYLELKAQSKKNPIILFDEPGLYLHSKAQADIKKLFEELAKNGCQIVYSTHSPYLIDVDKLNRVRLIINDKKTGTQVEKITSDKLKGKKLDALKPIIDAMGLEIAGQLSPVNDKNVIVEGISDFYYFQAMRKLLSRDDSYCFIPSQGAQNSHLLMELCIGWGVNWQMVFDHDEASKIAQDKITKSFGDEVQEKIYTLVGYAGIENIFGLRDIKLVNSSASIVKGDDKAQYIQANLGGKELFARQFLDQVNAGVITKDKLTKQAVDEFTKAFDTIEERFNI